MTGQSTGRAGATTGLPPGELDAETAERIDVHLERAQDATDTEQKDFHVRHARQLLEVRKSA